MIAALFSPAGDKNKRAKKQRGRKNRPLLGVVGSGCQDRYSGTGENDNRDIQNTLLVCAATVFVPTTAVFVPAEFSHAFACVIFLPAVISPALAQALSGLVPFATMCTPVMTTGLWFVMVAMGHGDMGIAAIGSFNCKSNEGGADQKACQIVSRVGLRWGHRQARRCDCACGDECDEFGFHDVFPLDLVNVWAPGAGRRHVREGLVRPGAVPISRHWAGGRKLRNIGRLLWDNR